MLVARAKGKRGQLSGSALLRSLFGVFHFSCRGCVVHATGFTKIFGATESRVANARRQMQFRAKAVAEPADVRPATRSATVKESVLGISGAVIR